MSVENTTTDPHIKLSFALKQLDEHQGDIVEQVRQQTELVQQLSQHNEHLASLTSIIETRLNHGLQESAARITQTAIENVDNKIQNILIQPVQHLQETITSFESLQEQTMRKTQWRPGLIVMACGISMLLASGMTLFCCHHQEQTAQQNVNYLRYGLALKQAWPQLSKSERAKILGQAQADKKTL